MNKPQKLLQYLQDHSGQTLTRWQIMEEVWDNNLHVQSRTLDVHIMNLRNQGHEIETIHGVGYRYE